jgi:hypothetical protein
MGREVRMVPADWQHPKDGFYANGSVRYIALFEGCDLSERQNDWDAEAAKWAAGEFPSYADKDDRLQTYEEWAGGRPDLADYMPAWPDAERTHYMMYEDTSEGTPISPAFATPEELARWLVDNGASSFGHSTASYESWLRVCQGGWAPSLVADANGVRSGVEFLGGK